MSLLDLPNELLFLIAKHLTRLRHLNFFIRTNRRLHTTLNDVLYRRFVEMRDFIPVLWESAKKGLLLPVDKIITFAALSPDDGFSETLLAACKGGQESMVKALIGRGANVNMLTWYGNWPLHMAVACGHENIVLILLENGADMTRRFKSDQYTVFHLATRLGRIDMMELLLDAGMDIEIGDGRDRTALEATFFLCRATSDEDRCYACGGSKPHPRISIEAMKLLLQRKANIRAGQIGDRPKDKARKDPNRRIRDLFREYDGYDSAEEDIL